MKRKLLKTAILIFCVALAAEAQTINLQLQNNYALPPGTGSPIPRFAVGDLNNDGRPDIVTVTAQVGTPVSVLLNDGAGGFNAAAPFGADLDATAVAIGDFNNDGCADLAIGTINNTNGQANISLGNCTGSFSSGTFIPTLTQRVTDIATADFNGDGNLDLAVTNALGYNTQPTNAVRILFGNGAGGFGSPADFEVGSQPVDLEVADFNSDGRPDIAVVAFTTTNTVRILLNTGGGTFSPVQNFSWMNATSAARAIAADFNRDGATDLAVIRTDSVAILFGNNTGGFTLTSVPVSNAPVSLAVGDFNLDRKTDLAIGRAVAAGGNGFIILPGDGAGNFGAAFSLNLTSPTDNLAVLDANRDGKTDIVLSTRSNSFSLYHGSSARFVRTEHDFDADGRADLSVFRPSLGDWFILRSTQGFTAAHWGVSTDKIVPADYDGDFKTDLAVWRETGYGDPTRSYFFILQSSDNTFRQEQLGSAGDLPTIVGDWDGDGRADVAVYRGGVQSYFYYRPSASPGISFISVPWGTSGDKPVRGDFDGDGRFDAAVFRPSNSVWYVLKSSDNQPIFLSWGLANDRPVPADYDGDGKTDIAVFRPSDSVWYILNSADGTAFIRQWGISTDTPVPADYNGDGKAETAVYRASEQRWYIPIWSVTGAVYTKFGTTGDVAVPAAP